MAFGFFKKAETADLVLQNGHIYTQNPDFPWASAVACKEDKIISIGDDETLASLIGSETEVIDLDGKFVFPGFIDIHRSPVQNVFEGKYADLTDCETVDEIIDVMTDWAEENPDSEVIFGYGYNEKLKPEDFDDEEATDASDEEVVEVEDASDEQAETSNDFEATISAKSLDQVSTERPVLLLAKSNVHCWTNSVSDQIIISTADEEMVQVITVPYVLNLLIPFDFEEIEAAVLRQVESLCDKGFTSVLSIEAPDYFQKLYEDSIVGLYNEEMLTHRFFGSFFANRPLVPRGIIYNLMTKKTNCMEMGDFIHSEMFNLHMDQDTCPVEFTQEILNTILTEVADKGFSIFIEALTKDDLLKAYNALDMVREKGYKIPFVIASDYELDKEDSSQLLYWESAIKTWGTNPLAQSSTDGHIASVEEAIDHMTSLAARVIGMENQLGSIKKGMLADFCVYDENPLLKDMATFAKMHTSMVIMGGKLVYDADGDRDNELYNLMASQQL